MPINVGYRLQNPQIIDLASLQMKQRAMQEEKDRQAMANLGSIIETISKYQTEQKKKQSLKDLGILVEEPITKTLKVGSKEWGKYADEQIKRGIVVSPASGDITIPTGKTRDKYDYTKLSQLPAGIEVDLPGLGKYKGPKQSDFWSSLFSNFGNMGIGATTGGAGTNVQVNNESAPKANKQQTLPADLPSPGKYAEGAILKADGKPIAKKIRGKWQSIQ